MLIGLNFDMGQPQPVRQELIAKQVRSKNASKKRVLSFMKVGFGEQ
jgi:hypothetical protein